ncbi:hypothetical protein Tco_1132398 [Tanacetum coccineum]|uniref:Uncharacterized protein n=1 Tax=Tanacetum coccineum TaxID=301880 RepID=A0ABQ5JBT2_9ASTR
MTIFPDISRRARDAYHNLQDDDIMKNIFNSGRNKNKVGMRIPAWMITDEMKLTEHYKMYAEVFGLDVPLTQSQPTESTQGTHRTPSAPRSPNPATETAESSVPKRSTVILKHWILNYADGVFIFNENLGIYEIFASCIAMKSICFQEIDNLLLWISCLKLVKEKVTEQVKKEVHVQVGDQVPVYLAKGLILEGNDYREEES